ncbi:hypothetical protein AB0P21_02435 [Kribbella sp. NPDC056861]|uniref:hypothetical protein n=1 Tax=Kribbella sp. NPDC056861 TaxID=3154857 RepID=UPI00343F7BC9
MITGRAVVDTVLSRVVFALGVLGVIGVIVGHGVTLDRAAVGGLVDGPTVQQVVVMDDGVELLSVPVAWTLELAEVLVATPTAPPDHCKDACAAFLSSGTVLLFGWAACRLISGKRQLTPRRTAIHALTAADSHGWRVLSPVKLGILRI